MSKTKTEKTSKACVENLDFYRPNVGITLINQEGLIFIAQRIDTPGPTWQMPQGGMDEDEEPLQAALRELEEETGVTQVDILDQTKDWVYYDVPKQSTHHLWTGRFKGQKQIWFLMRHLGEDEAIDLMTSEPEFSNWMWAPASEVLERVVEFKRDVYMDVLKDFKDYLA